MSEPYIGRAAEAAARAKHNRIHKEAKARKKAKDLSALLSAAKEMDALMDNLWKAVQWGKTFNLDLARLNTAPQALKAAIASAEIHLGVTGGK